MSMTTADSGARIRQGLSMSLATRQERWDRMKAWEKQGKSLEEIRKLEQEQGLGLPMSRERVRKILANAKPGTVPRPVTRGLKSRRTKLTEQLIHWSEKDTPHARERVVKLASELEAVERGLR